MINAINREKISTLLRGPLPGEAAQMKMAPETRAGQFEDHNCRQAAVLILLYPAGEVYHVIFIKRNEYDGPHSGQISFPGGMHELSDDDLCSTALRETEEEIGIKKEEIEILGQLTPLFIPVSNFCVTPFVGWIGSQPDFYPDAKEVQYVLNPTVGQLLDPHNRDNELLLRGGVKIQAPFIRIEREIIWGATAMILSEFLDLIS